MAQRNFGKTFAAVSRIFSTAKAEDLADLEDALDVPAAGDNWNSQDGRVANNPTGATESARRGLSWSKDRDVACWYACGYWYSRGASGSPLVLWRDVERSRIVYWSGYRLPRSSDRRDAWRHG
jgi:hypothetical protein